jgi:tryptophan 2,3-dioxygenase
VKRRLPDLTYGSYLGLRQLLSVQRPLSRPASHDEMQFIIVHQAFELWFKLMLYEIDALFRLFRRRDVREAERLFRRLNRILEVFIQQIEVIETMVPSDFVRFRDLLRPASGFQSWQFREIEFAGGARDERYLRLFDAEPSIRRRLEARLRGPTLWEAFASMLSGLGFARADSRAVVRIYRDPKRHDLRMLCEAMIEYDELFQLWREHHVRMAERMIGGKPGTGRQVAAAALGERGLPAHTASEFAKTGPLGTHGVEYLKRTLDKRFFPVLWEARTAM